MLRIERILCPVDFSEFSTRALDYAYSLAKHYQAKLFVEHVILSLAAVYPHFGFGEAGSLKIAQIEANAGEELQKLVTAPAWNALKPEIIVQKGMLPESILTFAEERAIDLIVMGTHGRKGLDRLATGSVAENVLRKARCPVLVVRKPTHDFVNAEKGQDPVRLRKILFCNDFSVVSLRAMDYALSLAMEYDAELSLLRVLEHASSSPSLQSEVASAMQALEESVPPDARNWCTVRPLVRMGAPYEQIIQFALESQTDLVIMGVRGRNCLDLALFGSTTHRVIQLGSCPVLVIRN